MELGLDPYLSLTGMAVEEEEPVSPPKPQLQSKAVTRPSKSLAGKAPEPSLPESLSTFTWEETQEAFILPAQGASPLATLDATTYDTTSDLRRFCRRAGGAPLGGAT